MLETQSILMHEIGGGSLARVLQRSAAIVLMVIEACRFRQSRPRLHDKAAVAS